MAIYIDRNKPSSGLANLLAAKGRHGDTELVHMTKPEIQRLRNTGLMTLNPKTGLPEMFLGDIFKGLKTYAKNFIKPKNLIPAIGSMIGGAYLTPLIKDWAPILGDIGSRAAARASGTFIAGSPFGIERAATSAGGTFAGSVVGDTIADMFSPGPASYGLDKGTKKYDTKVGQKLDSMYGAGVDIPEFDSDIFPSMDIESGGPAVFHDDVIPSRIDVNRQIAALNKRNVPYAKWNTDNLRGEKLGRKFRTAPESLQKKLAGKQAADVRGLQAFIEAAKPTDLQRWEFESFDPTIQAKEALMQQYAMDNNLLLTPQVKAKVLDPWSKTKGLIEAKKWQEAIKAAPVKRALQDLAYGMEGTGMADAEKAEEEYMKDMLNTELGLQNYIPTSNKKYRTPFERRPVIPRRADEGGLVSLAHGGDMRRDFEGLVQGRGHGMQDNVIMDIKQKGGLLAVSPKEYVVPADIMSGLGNGNPDAGAEHMDKFISDFRTKKYGRDKQPPEMDGRTALQSLMA